MQSQNVSMSRQKPLTILLTGATGFLGSHLMRRLLSANARILVAKRSSSNTSRIADLLGEAVIYDIDVIPLEKIFKERAVDVIIHCATNYGRRDEEPHTILEANLFLPLSLLEHAAKNGVAAFINTDTILDKGISSYSLSKSQFKEWLKLYSTVMTCINVSLEHFYGPGDDRSKFVTFIIRGLIENRERIKLTAGEQKRDFIYIEDVIDAFLFIINASRRRGVGFFNFEIGSGQSVTIRDFVCEVRRLVGSCATILEFGALPYRENEVMETVVDTSAIRTLGWTPSVSLASGLQRTIDAERLTK